MHSSTFSEIREFIHDKCEQYFVVPETKEQARSITNGLRLLTLVTVLIPALIKGVEWCTRSSTSTISQINASTESAPKEKSSTISNIFLETIFTKEFLKEKQEQRLFNIVENFFPDTASQLEKLKDFFKPDEQGLLTPETLKEFLTTKNSKGMTPLAALVYSETDKRSYLGDNDPEKIKARENVEEAIDLLIGKGANIHEAFYDVIEPNVGKDIEFNFPTYLSDYGHRKPNTLLLKLMSHTEFDPNKPYAFKDKSGKEQQLSPFVTSFRLLVDNFEILLDNLPEDSVTSLLLEMISKADDAAIKSKINGKTALDIVFNDGRFHKIIKFMSPPSEKHASSDATEAISQKESPAFSLFKNLIEKQTNLDNLRPIGIYGRQPLLQYLYGEMKFYEDNVRKQNYTYPFSPDDATQATLYKKCFNAVFDYYKKQNAGENSILKSKLDEFGSYSENLLLLAAREGDIESIEIFIDGGADVNLKDKTSGMTPLIYAAIFNKVDAVKKLIEKGADLYATDNSKEDPRNAFDWADSTGHLEPRAALKEAMEIHESVNLGQTD